MSGKESEYFNDKVGSIELVRCPISQEFCGVHLKKINKFVQLSRGNWISKDYPQAIQELKEAFEQTMKINPSECARCTVIFRLTIIRSMENLHEDLRQMTSGFFRVKRHLSSLKLAEQVLQEMKERTQSI
ncbi:MAG: hypothetical protein JNK09_13040 [Prolixibacteraceae bacterium]|nr:hypothetical protein [Prolixibacteraceae bacterium]